MAEKKIPVSHLCETHVDRIIVRGHDLTADLMGEKSFTEVFFLLLTGRLPKPTETRLVDAVLLSLMEHGMMPQAIAARMIARCEPEAMQAAIAAGLLGIGSRFGGAMGATAELLDEIKAADDKKAVARDIVARLRKQKKSVPGFGHPLHKPEDPRAQRLLQIAREGQIAGAYVEALQVLSQEMDANYGRHMTINAPGAIAAVLGDLGFPSSIMRGFAVVSRSAGLVAHLLEEQEQDVAKYLGDIAEGTIRYTEESLGTRKSGDNSVPAQRVPI